MKGAKLKEGLATQCGHAEEFAQFIGEDPDVVEVEEEVDERDHVTKLHLHFPQSVGKGKGLVGWGGGEGRGVEERHTGRLRSLLWERSRRQRLESWAMAGGRWVRALPLRKSDVSCFQLKSTGDTFFTFPGTLPLSASGPGQDAEGGGGDAGDLELRPARGAAEGELVEGEDPVRARHPVRQRRPTLLPPTLRLTITHTHYVPLIDTLSSALP